MKIPATQISWSFKNKSKIKNFNSIKKLREKFKNILFNYRWPVLNNMLRLTIPE